jgi:alkylation response protein AidB-like acyl-CoA dehydrogenase
MDFSFSDEQEAIRDLARQIFADRVTHERSSELEKSSEWFDGDLWKELTKANLTALPLPEEVGGSGCGILEICLVLEEMGRHLAPVPLFPTLLLGGAPLAEFGTAEQRERWLTPVAESGAVLTAALEEAGCRDPARPRTRALKDGSRWRLEGEKVCVPAAHLADCILVPARSDDSAVGVFAVEPHAPGVAIERQITTNREPHGLLTLDGAEVSADAVLGQADHGAAVVQWITDRALVGLCAVQVGVAEEALRRSAEYTGQRKQFGRPIATFQGVAMRAADAYIDVECMRSTLYQAAWRVSAGLPAGREIAAAKWWACRGGERVVHTAQHLHAGIGSDVDYPIHRFFLWSKQTELALGGASHHLARLGSMLTAGAGNARPR